MKSMRVLVLSLVLVLLVSGVTFADPGVLYGTGLIQIPTSDTVGPGEAEIRFHQVGSSLQLVTTVGITNNLELNLGFGSRHHSDSLLSGLGIKGKILAETKDAPGLALGLQNDAVYAVASKRLDTTYGIRGHLGISVGPNSGPFIGVEKTLNPVSISKDDNSLRIPPMTALVEFSNLGLTAGMRFAITSDLALDIAVADMKDLAIGGRLRLQL